MQMGSPQPISVRVVLWVARSEGGRDWARAQEIEEEQVRGLCERLLELKPDLIITEKGISGVFSFPPYLSLFLSFSSSFVGTER